MTESWPTFWTEPTGFVRVSLRRFTFGEYPAEPGRAGVAMKHEACPARPVDGAGYQQGHDGSTVVLEYAPQRVDEHGRMVVWPPDEFRDELWPQTCRACGAASAADWNPQANQDEYLKADGVGQWPASELPVGGMFDAVWLSGTAWVGADGISLYVMLPPGGPSDLWCCDCPSTDGNPWTREGDPRQASVTAAPSILTPRWHGFLRNGELLTA